MERDTSEEDLGTALSKHTRFLNYHFEKDRAERPWLGIQPRVVLFIDG